MPPVRAQRGTGFVDFGRYLDANRPQAEGMATRVAAPIMQQGQAVERGLAAAGDDMGAYGGLAKQATDVSRRANALGNLGGVAAAVQDLGPRSSTYGLGMNLLDAGLTGAAGGGRFEQLRDRYGGLFGRVAGAAKEAQQRSQAPKPAAPPVAEPEMPEEMRPGRPLYKRDDLDGRPRRQRGMQRYDFL